MPNLNVEQTRDLLQDFEFQRLFTDQLGWSQPAAQQPVRWVCDGAQVERRQIAQLSGVAVLEVTATDGEIPDRRGREAIYRDVARVHHENLLIFVGRDRAQSLWYWVKRDGSKRYPREHLYVRGQPGDLFLSKVSAMVFDISRFDESGSVPLADVAASLRNALDVERVTKKFYEEFKQEHGRFLEEIKGIDDERDRRWYASVLLNRLMFAYFLQRKHFLDGGNERYLQDKLAQFSPGTGAAAGDGCEYYATFLYALFFQGFALPEGRRTPEARRILGPIPYLNGGLFLTHPIEARWPDIRVSDRAFRNLFDLFERYSWNLNDTPGGKDDEINPDVLGYIFEKYINQKAFGAYYTRPEITEYLCERTIHQVILDKINPKAEVDGQTWQRAGVAPPPRFDSLADLLLRLDAPTCHRLLFEVLPSLSILDPACGSGAFLVAAMKTLINVYSAVTGRIEYLNDQGLRDWLRRTRAEHRSLSYFIKREIIKNSLFGVDIMEEASEIARVRLFLALVSSVQSADQLEPLPNLDFNVMAGNSLIGLMRVDEARLKEAGTLLGFAENYSHLVALKNEQVRAYRDATSYSCDLAALRDKIDRLKADATKGLNSILLDDFGRLGIRFEEATWDAAKGKEGRPRKRPLTLDDIRALHPFHWGYEFDEVLNARGGFDAIITNPPWEILKPQAKEFFAEHSDVVTKNRMTIKEFEKEQAKLLRNEEVRDAWLAYQSRFPHVSAYFRSAKQYENQISIVNGKKAGTDINLYKLFVEQCYNLIREGGRCGVIVPSGIYTDLGTKQLRETLFGRCRTEVLLGLSNEKYVFEGVHHAQRFCVLVFARGGQTETLEVAFRINPRDAVGPDDLHTFLRCPEGHLRVPVALIRRLSPDSLSVMEFRFGEDVTIAEKALRFPLLGEALDGVWNLALCNEFHMTNDSGLFLDSPGEGRLPLYEGKMIHQFSHCFSTPRYWVNEKDGRSALLGRTRDDGRTLGYQQYRLGHRAVASNTNERTMIAAVLPPGSFYGHSINATSQPATGEPLLFAAACLNSLTLDYGLRQRVAQNLTMFYIYQLPVPRLTERDAAFAPIVERAARLTCTTPEFDALAKEVGLGSHKAGATDPAERARLRAELDGLIAHLYGLTEEEFAHILSTFPLVPDPVKVAARNAYRDVERGLVK